MAKRQVFFSVLRIATQKVWDSYGTHGIWFGRKSQKHGFFGVSFHQCPTWNHRIIEYTMIWQTHSTQHFISGYFIVCGSSKIKTVYFWRGHKNQRSEFEIQSKILGDHYCDLVINLECICVHIHLTIYVHIHLHFILCLIASLEIDNFGEITR